MRTIDCINFHLLVIITLFIYVYYIRPIFDHIQLKIEEINKKNYSRLKELKRAKHDIGIFQFYNIRLKTSD